MEDKLELNDISNDLLIINKTTIERLFQEENKDIVILYMFYYKTAKWQNTNSIKANDEYVKKCLHWGTDKVRNLKNRLKEMELIEIDRRLNEKKQVIGWYIKLKYYKTTMPETTTPISPQVASQETNAIDNNSLNTLDNKDLKEINKEKKKYSETWDCDEFVKYFTEELIRDLNERTERNFKPNNTKTISLVRARLRDGFKQIDFFNVIETKCNEWLNTDMEQYLRPETLFGTKFENYVNQRRKQW